LGWSDLAELGGQEPGVDFVEFGGAYGSGDDECDADFTEVVGEDGALSLVESG